MKGSKQAGKQIIARLIFGLAIFTSAFLLFQVQLLLGKFLLPWFGGTSAVWATCLLFFQLLLLAGYLYAHQISTSCRVPGQGKIHLAFLALSTLWILSAWYFWGSPLLPGPSWKPAPGAAPIAGILKLLVISVGVPFLLLSSTGPLLQNWYANLKLSDKSKAPYFLYALSNAGSLLGLLSYPLFLEPVFRLTIQSWIWGAGFAFFALCCAACAWQAHRSALRPEESHPFEESLAPVDENPAPPQRWLWFILPMLGSVMLLATTNLLTQDVAPIPLLWVLPLCVYLLSFVFTFHGTWYRRAVFHPLFAITALLAVLVLFRGAEMRVISQIAIFLALLLAACMVCHGELARTKPSARYLTSFYLLLSAGGAAGGIFVAIIAPSIFPTFWEYQLGLWAIAVLLGVILFLDRDSWLHDPKPDLLVPVAFLTVLLAVPKYLAHARMITIPAQLAFAYNVSLGLLIGSCVWLALTAGPNWARRRKFRWYELTLVANLLVLTAALYAQLRAEDNGVIDRRRNFYGGLSVRQRWDDNMLHSYFELMHGRTTHGIQLESRRRLPTTYYTEKSGAGLALSTNPRRTLGSMRVGAIGLGIGTVAAYSRTGDVYRFYELNPAVIRLAQGEKGYFSFLRDAPARIEIVPGDARLSLEGEAAGHNFQNFDLLIVDAFNGDSIPVHLLTREAMKLYLSHLRGPDSVIAVHISNRAVDLAPVVAALANLFGLQATQIFIGSDTHLTLSNDWILLTRGSALEASQITNVGHPLRATTGESTAAPTPLWTDDYSNIITLFAHG